MPQVKIGRAPLFRNMVWTSFKFALFHIPVGSKWTIIPMWSVLCTILISWTPPVQEEFSFFIIRRRDNLDQEKWSVLNMLKIGFSLNTTFWSVDTSECQWSVYCASLNFPTALTCWYQCDSRKRCSHNNRAEYLPRDRHADCNNIYSATTWDQQRLHGSRSSISSFKTSDFVSVSYLLEFSSWFLTALLSLFSRHNVSLLGTNLGGSDENPSST